MSAAADDARAEDFLRRFALPLVVGGEVHSGSPLGMTGLRRLRAALGRGLDGTAVGQSLAAERLQVLAEVAPVPYGPGDAPTLAEDPAVLDLWVALHDAAFLLHPSVADGLTTRGALRRLGRHAATLARSAPPPRTSAQVLLRHSALHRVFAVSREDIRVRFWAGQREFHGQRPPSRLLAWPELRRVREERWRVHLVEQLLTGPHPAHEEAAAFIEALCDQSPLTDLLNPRRVGPPLQLTRRVGLLRLPDLARVVAASYLEDGLPVVAEALAGAAQALLKAAAEASAPPGIASAALGARDLATLLCFISHLHLCTVLGLGLGDADGQALSAAAGWDREAARDLCGLFAALLHHFPALALPPDVAADAALMRRVRGYGERCLQQAGASRVNALALLCARALREPAPAPLPPLLP